MSNGFLKTKKDFNNNETTYLHQCAPLVQQFCCTHLQQQNSLVILLLRFCLRPASLSLQQFLSRCFIIWAKREVETLKVITKNFLKNVKIFRHGAGAIKQKHFHPVFFFPLNEPFYLLINSSFIVSKKSLLVKYNFSTTSGDAVSMLGFVLYER